ncbi:MAG: flagellar basal body-associated FliL family protein [Baekduia sp.]
MKDKLKFIIPVVLIALGGVWKFVLAPPPAKAPKPKVEGTLYVLPKDFLINLEGGRYAKLSVALILEPHVAADAGNVKHASAEAAPDPPEGYGIEPQEALIRSIITDTLTGVAAGELQERKSRKHLQKEILERLHKETDVHVSEVLFTDLAIQ